MKTKTKYLSWYDDVLPRHGTYAGISIEDGVVVSLLCSTVSTRTLYENQFEEDKIEYVVPAHQSKIRAFEKTAGLEKPVQVFRKIDRNKWLDLGTWLIGEESLGTSEQGQVFSLSKV